MKKITFHLGAEKQIKISTAGHSDSLFYEGYRQALAGVIEIVRASSGYGWEGLLPFHANATKFTIKTVSGAYEVSCGN